MVRFQASPGKLLLIADRVGKFLISNGDEILIEKADGVADDEIRWFLFSAVLGPLLIQRDMLAMRAAAFVHSGEAVLIFGMAGMGKSTLIAAANQRGFTPISDEPCLLETPDRKESGPVMVKPGLPFLKLWRDSLNLLQLFNDDLKPVRPGLEKYIAPITNQLAKPLPIKRAYLLEPAKVESATTKPISGAARFRVFQNMICRPNLIRAMGNPKKMFEQCASLAEKIDLRLVDRSEKGMFLGKLIAAIEKDLQS